MKHISILENTIQEYAWGSYTAIAELLGTSSPSVRPQAELWMGAHPKAPSLIEYEGKQLSLAEVIANHPEDILGKAAAQKFDNRLPYLFKVLAAAKPLSIQAHPNQEQAEEGFERENRRGIPPDAPKRNYKDRSHKPECLCALTRFWGLRGFRSIPEILSLTEQICPAELEPEIRDLRKQPDSLGLKSFFHALMTMTHERKRNAITQAVRVAQKEDDLIYRWILRLYDDYPEDIGVLSPVFLNLICLEPGQSVFLPAGELHAYLDGVGIELMANSDNVLRGGLTPKHIDVPELLRVLHFTAGKPDILLPRKISEHEAVYDSPAEEFVLSVIAVRPGMSDAQFFPKSVEILLCTQGEAILTADEQSLSLVKGMSVMVPCTAETYHLRGNATFYKAAVPLSFYTGEEQ